MKIETLILQPESVTLEIKENIPTPDIFAKLLVAFSNQKGGAIIIGVNDKSRAIKGINPDFPLEEWIMNVASTNCHPTIFPVVEFHTISEKVICVIKVYQGRFKPYFVKKLGEEKGIFVRVGSTIRIADSALTRHLQRESMHLPFDHFEVVDASLKDISGKKVDDFLTAINFKKQGTQVKNTYLNFGIVRKKNGDVYPTIGGLLLFGETPQIAAGLPCASVKIGRFAGTDVTSPIIDQMLIEGDLRHQIETVETFMKRNLYCKEKMKGFRRIDVYEYPIEVLRELAINAISHRDYFLAAKENIKISIFKDRIEFFSPGLLPEDITVENIFDRQVSRNPMITRILFRWGYLEAWGKGLDKARKILSKNKFPPLELAEGDNFFKIVVRKP
jgi:predicted HTH transcriptional regulator